MLRVAEPLTLNTPPRNHTGPDWPAPAFAPVSSNSGCPVTGSEYAHCHHNAVQSEYECPYGMDAGGITAGLPRLAPLPGRSAPCAASAGVASAATSKAAAAE